MSNGDFMTLDRINQLQRMDANKLRELDRDVRDFQLDQDEFFQRRDQLHLSEPQYRRYQQDMIEGLKTLLFTDSVFKSRDISLRTKKNREATFLDRDESVIQYSKSEAKKIRKDYNKAISKGKTMEINRKRLFASEDFMKDLMKEKAENCEDGVKTQAELYEKVKSGEFKDYEKLDPLLKEKLAVEYANDKLPLLLTNDWDAVEKIVEQLNYVGHEALAHPLLRLAISLGMRGLYSFKGANGRKLEREDFVRLDDLINQQVMINTLVGPQNLEEQKKAIEEELNRQDKERIKKPVQEREAEVEDMIQRDKNSRKYILKTLLLAQLGDFYKNTTTERKLEYTKKKVKETKNEIWTGSMATAFAHCSRVMFTLPSEHGLKLKGLSELEKTRKLNQLRTFREKYQGKQKGLDEKTGFFSRGAATHRASAGTKKKKAGEEKWTLGWYLDQSGINVAVGGIGAPGINKRTLLNDGSCGHLYRYYREGSDSEYGVMMLGFESDSYKKKNQLGHTHGFGNGESASSFGGLRVDEIGDKYGGRTVDVSGLDMGLLTEMFMAIDEIVDEGGMENEEKLKTLSKLLSGKSFRKETFTKFEELCTTLFGPGSSQRYAGLSRRETGKPM